MSFLVGMIYLTIYRYPRFMHGLIFSSIIVSEIMMLFFVYLFIQDYYKNYDLMCKGTVIDPEFCDYEYFSYYLFLAGLAFLIAIIFAVTMWKKRQLVRTGIFTIQLSCRPIGTLKQLFIYPVIQLIVGGLLLIMTIVITLYMLSTGQIILYESEEVPGGKSK